MHEEWGESKRKMREGRGGGKEEVTTTLLPSPIVSYFCSRQKKKKWTYLPIKQLSCMLSRLLITNSLWYSSLLTGSLDELWFEIANIFTVHPRAIKLKLKSFCTFNTCVINSLTLCSVRRKLEFNAALYAVYLRNELCKTRVLICVHDRTRD